MINIVSQIHRLINSQLLTTSLALFAFFLLSLFLSCSADTTTTNSTTNKTTLTGTLTYSALDIIAGSTSPTTANPTWAGAFTNQTVTYTLARQDGASLPASITIDSSNGTVNVGADVGFQADGAYTVTASGTGNYTGTTTANLVITITIIINTAAELQAITNNIVTLDSPVYNTAGTNVTGATGKHIGGNYQLGRDIDLSGITNFTPIGSIKVPFIGIFDGKGHTVTLAINSTKSHMGLFGFVGVSQDYIDDTATVRKINNTIEIKDIGVRGTIAVGGSYTGGLVGRLSGGSIRGHSEVTITSTGSNGASSLGGLVGSQTGGTIIGYATGDVSGNGQGTFQVGGLVGYQIGGTIIGYATGNTSGSIQIGGLVGGQARGSIIGYATGNVSVVSSTFTEAGIGGAIGKQTGGTVTGYATGAVTGTATNMQGFIGEKTGGSIQGGYFDAATAGQTDSASTSISTATNIYKFAGPVETSGRTVGKFYDKATGTSATAEDSGDTEMFTVQEFIDAFDLGNTPNGRFPKLKTSLFGTFTQP